MTKQIVPHQAVNRVEGLESRRLLSAIPVGDEFRVNPFTPGGQYWPSAAMDSDGDFVIAWSGEGPGDGYGIFAQRFSAAGTAQGDPFRVNTYTTGSQVIPSVAMDADGDFVIAWRDGQVGADGQDGSGTGIHAQRFNATGVAQGGELRVNTYTTNNQEAQRIAMDPDGDFVIAWNSYYQDGSNNGIYAQRYNAAGVRQGGEFLVNTYTTGGQRFADIAMDADGDFVIAWASSGGSEGGGTYARDYSASGVPQRNDFRVTSTLGLGGRFHGVAMDDDGEFVVAFEGGAQRFNSSHLPAGDPIVANTGEWIDVAMDTDGDFAITWQSFQGDGSSWGVYAQQVNSSGALTGSQFRVNTYTTERQVRPAIACDGDGDFVISWVSFNQDGSSYGIYAQRYAVVPELVTLSFAFATAPHQLLFTFDRDVSASLGIDDLLVQNVTTNQPMPSSDFSVSYDPGTNVATFSYTGPGESIGVLSDGNYRATLLAPGIATAAGAPLGANQVLDFFILAGDANRDRKVDVADLGILATNWQQSPRTFAEADFDYSRTVDVADLGILASHWQQELPQPSVPETRRTSARIIDQVLLA